MTFFNSYFRAFLFSVLISLGVLVIGCQYDLSGSRGYIFLSLLGIVSIITVLLVGTFSRGEKPWPWLKTGMACFGCYLATVFAIAFLTFVFIRPR